VRWVDEFELFWAARLDALEVHLDRAHGKRKS